MTSERVLELLDRLANLLRSEARQIGAAQGLQPVQLHALAFLARANRYSDSPLAVAEYLELTKGTVSQTIAVLEARQLVAREPDERDRRRQHLVVTPRGKRVLQKLPPASLVDALATTGRGEALADGLTAVLVAMQTARGGRTFGVCATCRHHQRRPAGAFCGLTGERLAEPQVDRLCREHEPAPAG